MANTRKPDARQMRRLKAAISKAERRLNVRIITRIAELSKDPDLKNRIEEEMKDLKSVEDFNKYVRNSINISRNETR